MSEHRTADRLVSYWNTLRKDEPMPDFSKFNISAIDDLWQQCVLFTVSPTVDNKPNVINFYQIGEKLNSIYGSDMVGRSFSTNQRNFQGAAIMRRMEQLFVNPEPLTDTGQFVNERSKVVKYRSCLLPFGREKKVTHVVSGLSWREF